MTDIVQIDEDLLERAKRIAQGEFRTIWNGDLERQEPSVEFIARELQAVRDLEREFCAKIAESAEEFPGEPTPEHMALMQQIGIVATVRTAAQTMKASIANRIRKGEVT